MKPEIRKIKCGADERRHPPLAVGEPSFLPKAKMQTNRPRDVLKKRIDRESPPKERESQGNHR